MTKSSDSRLAELNPSCTIGILNNWSIPFLIPLQKRWKTGTGELRGFGAFSLRECKARVGRNPEQVNSAC